MDVHVCAVTVYTARLHVLTMPSSLRSAVASFPLPLDIDRVTGGLVALLGLAVGGCLAAFVPLTDGLRLLAIHVCWAAPGVWYLHRGLTAETRGHAWWFGPVVGQCGSLLFLLVPWSLGHRGSAQLLLAPLAWWLVLGVVAKVFPAPALRLPTVGKADLRAVCLVLLLVPALLVLPAAKLGEDRPDGRAYRAYFTADVIWAMAVVAEVSKGDMPPQNPFIHNEPLRYYWLSHFLSAVEYRTMGDGVTKAQILLTNALAAGLVFVAFFYGLIRTAVGTPWVAAVAASSPFLWNSFEGLDRLVVHWMQGQPWSALTTINIDSVTRWFYGGLPVDGLQRMLLYQPHHLIGYAAGLFALIVVARAEAPWRPFVALAAGAGLACSVLLSTFTALLLAATVACVYAWRLIDARRWMALPLCAIVGAIPMVGAVAITEYFEYVDRSGGSFLRIGVNAGAAHNWWWNLLLSFGPLLPLALVGIVIAGRRLDARALPAAVLGVVALAFYFLVDVPEVSGWVAWRAGHLLLMASAVFVGVVLERVMALTSRATRAVALTTVALLAVAAAPTVAIDIYNAQDTDNPHMGPGFPWVLRISSDEQAALRWLQVNTKPWDLVQVDAIERGPGSWAYIPAFGERRMAGGVPISMVPVSKYERVSRDIQRNLFGADTALDAFMTASRYNIRYLYLGRQERRRWPGFEAMLAGAPHLYARMFSTPDAAIYRVGRPVMLETHARPPLEE